MKPNLTERVFTSAWHLGLFAIGLWELQNHKSRAGKFFAAGFTIWHLDAAQADFLGRESVLKQALRQITNCQKNEY